ncbi:Phosphatase 2C family protein isoform 1 [Hibiscus syriacus]|uniref:Histidine-containing phosphotransfer protein n=1 Tax=Hibiscus syriacus TaxID=106335 RepID=A0A6A2Y099_HIBSY|nr:Phosphatase 2C family protein isoform 1 [Hibiscus syriacus]
MESRHFRQQIAALRQSFFDEGILDEQFTELEQLEEKGNPSFLQQVFTMYFNDSTTVLDTVEQALGEIDVVKLEHVLHKFKGSSASVGAKKVVNEIIKTRRLLGEGNLEGAKVAFQELRKEYENLKAMLEHYFQQLAQAGPVQAAQLPN